MMKSLAHCLLFVTSFAALFDTASAGCCSQNYKQCDVSWCGTSEDQCLQCNGDQLIWLPNGPRTSCTARWSACTNNRNGCCSGLECVGNQYYRQCLPATDSSTTPRPTSRPTPRPTSRPTRRPTSRPTPQPSRSPTTVPAPSPTKLPTPAPTNPTTPAPTSRPTRRPTSSPTPQPSRSPTPPPTNPTAPAPTPGPTRRPTPQPSRNPTTAPIPSPTPPPTSSGDPKSADFSEGKATYYGGNPSGGACGYSSLPTATFPFGASVAVGGEAFDNGYGCGACYEVSCVGPYGSNPSCYCDGTKDSVIVQATDQCPECGATHFDLNPAAMNAITGENMSGTCGVIETLWRRVSCPFEKSITIRSKSGTSGWWYALHVDDVAGYGAISSVKIRQNGSTEFDIVCDKSGGPSFWLCHPPSTPIKAPLDVALTDSAGRLLIGENIITDLGGDKSWNFGKNFDGILSSDPTTSPMPPPQPTNKPTSTPTKRTAPTADSVLLRTDEARNAWEVYQGLASLTHVNSQNPPNYAFVSSGGVAGDGSYVVSESQSYALLITGTVLASWDDHAGKVSGSSRSAVLKSFEGYYTFWKSMCATSSQHNNHCQSGGKYCFGNVCLPDWKHSKTGGSVGTGAAPDADEDAIVGIILAVTAVSDDSPKPSWYDEARSWADASASAFFQFNVDKSRSGKKLVKLGSCWGGWESNGNNPSYHSPGSYRIMRDYQKSYSGVRNGYSAVPVDQWNELIATSHEVLLAVQCPERSGVEGALVPNWATIGLDSRMDIVHTGGGFSGSGTPQYQYGAEASRTTFRVALDAVFYPEYSVEWSPYLSAFHWRLDENFNAQAGSWPTNTLQSCRGPNTQQDIQVFGDWTNNAFIYGPTYTSLIAASPSVPNAQSMVDAAGKILKSTLPSEYFARSWTLISSLMLSGAMESAAKKFHDNTKS